MGSAETAVLKKIFVEFSPEACHHSPETDEIHMEYDERGGARWRSTHRFPFGTFSARIRCPEGNASGLNYNLYLSSLEGEERQDEVDFEFLGKDKGVVQTNFFVRGEGGREEVHELGFDSSLEFHDYVIRWEENSIEWFVDGNSIRRAERNDAEDFPSKPMFLYASVWDASCINDGEWAGTYVGSHEPYVCWYKDVMVPNTVILSEITVEYNPKACHHSPDGNEIHMEFDDRGGARWRSTNVFKYGTFGAKIRCPEGDTSGLNYNMYLSTLKGEENQDEISFEFLGKDKGIVQTNFYVEGVGGNEQIHELGFDSSEDFHEYVIRWEEDMIEWFVDGVSVRKEERNDDKNLPSKASFLYASVWDASEIDEGRWAGTYEGSDAPYICWYKDVRVPIDTVAIEEEEE